MTDQPTDGHEGYTSNKGRRQKSSCFGWYVPQMDEGGEGGKVPDHDFWKKTDHFLFLFLFDPGVETIKLFFRSIFSKIGCQADFVLNI